MSSVTDPNTEVSTIASHLNYDEGDLSNLANPEVLKENNVCVLRVISVAIRGGNESKEQLNSPGRLYNQNLNVVAVKMLANPVFAAQMVNRAGVAAATYLNADGIKRSPDSRVAEAFPHLREKLSTSDRIRHYVSDRVSDAEDNQPFSRKNRKNEGADLLEYYAPCPPFPLSVLKERGDLYLGSSDYESLEHMLAFMQDVEPFAKSRNPNLVDVEKRAVFLALKDILSTYRNALNSGDEHPVQLSQYPEYRNLLLGNVQQLKDAQKRRNPNI